jgi:Chitin synthase
MDEFSWGNTRLVVGEGKDKKIIMNEDEKFDESMIPLKKFSGMLLPIMFWTRPYLIMML